eukprot:91603_1
MATKTVLSLVFVVIICMSAWWKLQVLHIGDNVYYVWNHLRYSSHGYIDKNGIVTNNCTVGHCNASIYTQKDELSGAIKFKGKSYHDEINAIEHNWDCIHEDWGGSAMIREKAILAINLDIGTGKTPTEAFTNYLVSHPNETYALQQSNLSHRLIKNVRVYPSDPLTVEQIPEQTNSYNGWKLNYYGDLECEFKQELQNNSLDQSFKQMLTTGTAIFLQDKINSWRSEIGSLQKKVYLAEVALTLKNAIGSQSDFFLTHNKTCNLLVFGEELHFEIGNDCELWFMDCTFQTTPSFGGYLLYDQHWIWHGGKESGNAAVQSESWPTFHILFAAGTGNHTAEVYTEATNLVIEAGDQRGYNLRLKKHRIIADFDKPERLGVLDSELVLLTRYLYGCSYHWVKLWNNGLKNYDLWEIKLHDKQFSEFSIISSQIRHVPPRKMRDAFDEMMKKSETEIKKEHHELFVIFAEKYVHYNWINGIYAIEEFNEYRRQIASDNFAESMNNLAAQFLGTHTPYFLWLFRMKKFSAKHVARYIRFTTNGFERMSSVKENMKQICKRHLWDTIGSGDMSLWDYMTAMSYVYREKWDKVKEMCGDIQYDNVVL